MESLASADRLSQPWATTKPDQLNNNPDVNILSGNWSLQQLSNNGRIKTLIVIAVNAKTDKTTPGIARARAVNADGARRDAWDTDGQLLERDGRSHSGADAEPRHGSFHFRSGVRGHRGSRGAELFLNLPTSFSLTRTQADCLVAKGPPLLRAARPSTRYKRIRARSRSKKSWRPNCSGELFLPTRALFPRHPLHAGWPDDWIESAGGDERVSCHRHRGRCCPAVVAQTEGSVSVGIDYGVDIPMSDALEQKRAFGVSFRLLAEE